MSSVLWLCGERGEANACPVQLAAERSSLEGQNPSAQNCGCSRGGQQGAKAPRVDETPFPRGPLAALLFIGSSHPGSGRAASWRETGALLSQGLLTCPVRALEKQSSRSGRLLQHQAPYNPKPRAWQTLSKDSKNMNPTHGVR